MNVFENSLELFEKYKPTPLLRLRTRGDVFCQAGVL